MHSKSMNDIPAIAVVSIDGLATFKSGVGSIAHWFFEAFDKIAIETTKLRDCTFSLYALCPKIDLDSEDYSARVHSSVKDVCIRYGGDFHWFQVEDSSTLKSVWSLDNRERWHKMCANAAAAIRDLAAAHSQVTVISHGTMFTTLRSNLLDVPNVQIIYITHTLGRVFLDANSKNRTLHEEDGFQYLEEYPQDQIGYVGTYYRDILKNEYNRPNSQLTSFENSVFTESFLFSNTRAAQNLKQSDIPFNKKLIFSWGRCMPQKGFDVIVPAFRQFLTNREDREEWHLVLLMPHEVSPRDYIVQIQAELERIPPSSYTVLESFDTSLPHLLLKNPALKIAIFASRFEAGPLTLIEALAFGHPHLRIVWHKIPPMQHILKEQPHTFDFSPLDADAMCEALELAARFRGIGIVKEKVPLFSKNMATGLDSVLAWWEQKPFPAKVSTVGH